MKKKERKDEITVRVQRMFPNCQKYEKCCVDSGTKEMMDKVDRETKEMIDSILEKVKTKK